MCRPPMVAGDADDSLSPMFLYLKCCYVQRVHILDPVQRDNGGLFHKRQMCRTKRKF